MRMGLMSRCAIAVALVFTGWHTYAAADLNAQYRLNVPPLPVFEALKQFAAQTNLQVVYYTEEAEGAASPGAVGTLTAGDALGKILGGTGLTFQFLNDRTVAIRVANTDGRRADVRDEMRLAQANASESLWDRFRLAQAETVSGEQATDMGSTSSSRAQQASELGEIVVVGTNLRDGQVIGPVVVLSEEEIKRTGAMTVREVLQTLPQNSGAGLNETNGFFSATGVRGDLSSFSTGPNLRGLGTYSTLSLVNGRRFALAGNNGSSDVSQIPLAAIERIEVLTDSASAIYGADALGGVVNFVLKDDFDGARVNASLSGAQDGYEQQLYSATWGTAWSPSGRRGNVVAAYEFFDQTPLYLSDRPDLAPTLLALSRDGTLVPEQRRHSGFLHLAQDLGAGFEMEATAVLTQREGLRDSSLSSGVLSQFPFDNTQSIVQVSLTKDWSPNWSSDLTVSHSQHDLEQELLRPSTGLRIVTNRDQERIGAAAQTSGVFVLPKGRELGLAIGAEFGRDTLDQSQTVFPILPASAERETKAVFVEARTTLFGDVADGRGFAELSVAGRWDEYSDFGSTTNPKIGLRWRPVDAVQFSATWGTGFRTPTLNDLYGDATALTFDGSAIPDAASPTGFVTGNIFQLGGSNPRLGPEESESWSFTWDWRPGFVDGLNTRVNFYDIEIEKAIQGPGVSAFTAFSSPAYAPLITRSPSAQQVNDALAQTTLFINNVPGPFDPSAYYAITDFRLLNLARVHVTGADVEIAYVRAIGIGNFNVDFAASYIDDLSNQLLPALPEAEVLDTVGFPTDWRIRTSLGYTWSGYELLVALNYVDKYKTVVGGTTTVVDDWMTADLRLAYDWGKSPSAGSFARGFSAAFVVRNLIDEPPPAISGTAGAGLTVPIGYDPANANPFGRIIGVQLSKRF